MEQKVLVYYTGGTIGMTAERPRRPDPNFRTNMANALRGVPGIPDWDFDALQTPLDSSSMTPRHWESIARYIESRQHRYRAFVILHGTDTMAYTTSALTFMIRGLTKPIIFTGSQVPLAVPVGDPPRSDARANLIASLRLAGDYRLPSAEVCLVFGGKVLRGCRATKVSAEEWDAFDSPNFPPLARATEDGIELGEQVGLPPVVESRVVPWSSFRLFSCWTEAEREQSRIRPGGGGIRDCFGVLTFGPSFSRGFYSVARRAQELAIQRLKPTRTFLKRSVGRLL